MQLDALPPAAARGLAPEEEQLLRHADGGAARVAADVGAEAREGQAADYGFVGLAGAVAPAVVVVEAARGGVSVGFVGDGGSGVGKGGEGEGVMGELSAPSR